MSKSHKVTVIEFFNGCNCLIILVSHKLMGYNLFFPLEPCHENSTCIEHSGKSYTIYEDPGSWHQAAEKCRNRDQQLASMNKQDLGGITQKISLQISAILWIGLRKSDYFYTDKNRLLTSKRIMYVKNQVC